MNESMNSKVLIVDDVPGNLRLLRAALEPEGYKIFAASNGESALRIAARALPDIILLDIVMPGMDGYEICRRLKQNSETSNIPVIFITVKDENISLLEGFQVGGVDYITKPFAKEELLVRVKTHLEIGRLTRELLRKNRELQAEIAKREQAERERQKADEQLSMMSQQEASRWGIEGFIGKSQTIKKILNDVRQLQSVSRTSVLITGESGTGKELIARAIHFGGAKAKGPFIPVNCSAIPGELAESAFFGHVRGAFSGANQNRRGYFELADGGTLFLDEIGDMPLGLQPKRLRVIEDSRIVPVGGAKERDVAVRIIAATNQRLTEKIAAGTFREDLYFRLAGFTVIVPPLRERKEDIPLLIEHFLRLFSVEMGIPQPALSPEALEALKSYHFPGNVRELKNIMEHALLKSSGESILRLGKSGSPKERATIIKPKHLHFIDVGSPSTSSSPPQSVSENKDHHPDFKHLEELVIQRAQKPNGESDSTASSQTTDEEKILGYVRKHGSISNNECRELLSAEFDRASYLLKKMQRYGLLAREGERRWARYCLP